MDLTDIDIKTILPQKPPFVMVDKLIHCDKIFTRTSLLVREDNMFVCDGVLNETAVVENIAQTCAARMGFINRVLNSGSVKLGVIGAIRDFQIYRRPLVGEELETLIEVISEVFNVILVQAKVLSNNELIAKCEMKISEQ